MGQLRTSPPPPEATELQRWTLASGEDLRGLRASLHRALTGRVLGEDERLDDVPERVALVATELATNALRHGRPPTIVTLLEGEDCLILDVADHDLSSVPELADHQPFNSGGRGLQLARAFSLAVGWYATEKTKNIWASFPK